MTVTRHYEITRVAFGDKEALKRHFEDGWEPFAVVPEKDTLDARLDDRLNRQFHWVYLRRKA